jgi:hypothetical protein
MKTSIPKKTILFFSIIVLFFTSGCSYTFNDGKDAELIEESFDLYHCEKRVNQDEIECFFKSNMNKYPYMNSDFFRNYIGNRSKYLVLESNKNTTDFTYPIKIILLPSDGNKNCTEINLYTNNKSKRFSYHSSYRLQYDYVEVTSVLQQDMDTWMRGLVYNGYKIILTGLL